MTRPAPPPRRTWTRRVVVTRLVLAAAAVFAFVYFSITGRYFLTGANLLNLLNDLALAGIVALPATFLMMTGQVDLSVGAAFALTGLILASTVPSLGESAALAAAVLTGLAIGALNGALVTIARVNGVVTTFATMALARALAYLIPGGLPVVIPGFRGLGTARAFWGIAPPTLIFAGLAVAAALLSATRTGRRARSIGLQPRPRLTRRPERRWTMALYLITALAATLAGLIRTSQLGVGLPTAGLGLALTVLTAVLLGGAHLAGGRGSIGGTLIALSLIYVIRNGLSLVNITPYTNDVITAVLLIIALALDGLNRPGPTA